LHFYSVGPPLSSPWLTELKEAPCQSLFRFEILKVTLPAVVDVTQN